MYLSGNEPADNMRVHINLLLVALLVLFTDTSGVVACRLIYQLLFGKAATMITSTTEIPFYDEVIEDFTPEISSNELLFPDDLTLNSTENMLGKDTAALEDSPGTGEDSVTSSPQSMRRRIIQLPQIRCPPGEKFDRRGNCRKVL